MCGRSQTQANSLDWSRQALLRSVTFDHDLVVIRRLRALHSVLPGHDPSAPAVRLLMMMFITCTIFAGD